MTIRRETYEHKTILQIMPAPHGMMVVYALEKRGELCRSPCLVLALVETQTRYCNSGEEVTDGSYERVRCVEPLVDLYGGAFDTEDASNYIGLELPGINVLDHPESSSKAETIWNEAEKKARAVKAVNL